MQRSAVQCSVVQCSAVQCSAVQCSAVIILVFQFSAEGYNFDEVQCCAVQRKVVQLVDF